MVSEDVDARVLLAILRMENALKELFRKEIGELAKEVQFLNTAMDLDIGRHTAIDKRLEETDEVLVKLTKRIDTCANTKDDYITVFGKKVRVSMVFLAFVIAIAVAVFKIPFEASNDMGRISINTPVAEEGHEADSDGN